MDINFERRLFNVQISEMVRYIEELETANKYLGNLLKRHGIDVTDGEEEKEDEPF